MPVFAGVQLVPSFVETNTPPPLVVPAKINEPLTNRDWMFTLVSPEFVLVQVAPLSLDTYTPENRMPANMAVPFRTTDSTIGFTGRPVFNAVHDHPSLVDRKTPPLVPEMSVVPSTVSE